MPWSVFSPSLRFPCSRMSVKLMQGCVSGHNTVTVSLVRADSVVQWTLLLSFTIPVRVAMASVLQISLHNESVVMS